MAGAFASGFQMGGNVYNQAERNRLEQAAEERRATEFAQAQEDRARLVGLREQEDALRNQLTRPNLENYAFAPAGGQGGLGFRTPATAPAELPTEGTGLTMPQLGVPTGGRLTLRAAAPTTPAAPQLGIPTEGEPALRATAPTVGLKAPEVSTARQPTFNAAPTGAAAEDLLGRMALLKGDINAYRTSQEAARGFKYADAYKNARQSWDSMSNEEREALISKASYDTNIPGFGTWVPGSGKTEGYMNYMAPGKDPIKLSANDAREVYALTQAMEYDPMKARADLQNASDKVRSILKDSFEAQTKGVNANNLTTYHVSDLAERGRHNLAMENYQKQALVDGRNANKLSNVQFGFERDPSTNQLRQVMVGLQFNQKTGGFDEVRQPLTNNMIPASAFDAKVVNPMIESLVGTPIDKSNKNKDAPRHTEATARQAVMDSIANQYLGATKNPLSPENAAAAIIEKQKNQATNPPAPAATPVSAPKINFDPSAANPYRTVSRGRVAVDEPAIQKDLAEYNSLSKTGLQLAGGRKLFLQQKLQAAGVLDSDGNLK